MQQNKLRSLNSRFWMVLSFLAVPMLSFAETSSAESLFTAQNLLRGFAITVLVFAVGVLLYAVSVYNAFIKQASKSGVKQDKVFTGFMHSLTDAVPLENEDSVLTDHEYDGIRELDNNLPPWWVAMFYITIIFSGVYVYYYHFGGSGLSQDQEYLAQVEEARAMKEANVKSGAVKLVDENTVALDNSPEVLKKGAASYTQFCAACHGKAGEGGVGPNLTDKFWLHGGGVKNVFMTITNGVPDKGMIAWGGQLSPSDISDITNYIISLQGSNPAGAKDPQGEEYKGGNE